MYLIDFFKKLFKSKNIGIIIWLVFNILIFIFPFISISPNYPILGLLCGIAVYVGTIAIVLSPLGEWFFRLINGCKKIIDPRIINRLTPLFNEVYARAKMNDPNLSPNIKLYMLNDHYPNAFALGRNTVCVTRGLLHLDDEKIKGIFAHEFSHLSNKDTDFLLFIYIGNLFMTCAFMIARVMIGIMSFILGVATSDDDDFDIIKGLRGLIFSYIADFFYVIAVGLYTKLGLILVRHSMRKQEYEADKFAYDLGYGEQLRDALTELLDVNETPKNFAANLMSTHPDTFSRIDKLNIYLFQNSYTENINFDKNTPTQKLSNEYAQATYTENVIFNENTLVRELSNEYTQTIHTENVKKRESSNENSNILYKVLLSVSCIIIAFLTGYMFSKMNNNTISIKHTTPKSSQEQTIEQNNTKVNSNEVQLENNNQINTNSQDISDINLASKDFSNFSAQPSQNMTDLENISYLASNLPSVNFLIENFNSEELALLRNSIYAKYNRRFQTPRYSSYFSRKTWYRGEYDEVSERNFSQDEFDLLNNILIAEGKPTISR